MSLEFPYEDSVTLGFEATKDGVILYVVEKCGKESCEVEDCDGPDTYIVIARIGLTPEGAREAAFKLTTNSFASEDIAKGKT